MRPAIRVLVADDEPLVRRALTRFLGRQASVTLVGEAGDGSAAVAAIQLLKPDLVFLDIQMPEMNGFDVLASIDAAELPAVIFVTAFDEFAIQAFAVHAVDYLLKPFDDERLRIALRRGCDRVARTSAPPDFAGMLAAVRGDLVQRFVVRTGGRVAFVDVGAVLWIEAANNYVKLHTAERVHLVRDTITAVERRFAPRFVRIHRSVLVQTDQVRDYQTLRNGDCDVNLKTGTKLRMSRGYRDAFEQRLAGI